MAAHTSTHARSPARTHTHPCNGPVRKDSLQFGVCPLCCPVCPPLARGFKWPVNTRDEFPLEVSAAQPAGLALERKLPEDGTLFCTPPCTRHRGLRDASVSSLTEALTTQAGQLGGGLAAIGAHSQGTLQHRTVLAQRRPPRLEGLSRLLCCGFRSRIMSLPPVTLPERVRTHACFPSDTPLGASELLQTFAQQRRRGGRCFLSLAVGPPAPLSVSWCPEQGGLRGSSPCPRPLTPQPPSRPRRGSEQSHRPSVRTTHPLQPPQTFSSHSPRSAV